MFDLAKLWVAQHVDSFPKILWITYTNDQT